MVKYVNIENLTIFCSLVEQLHFRKTSERHHMTVSALTRMIQRMEMELSTQLFLRDNRSVSVTKAGKIFYGFAKQTLRNYSSTKQTIINQQTDEVHGSIRLYATVTAATHILPPIIKDFRERFPFIMTFLETGELKQGYERLTARETDVLVGVINSKIIRECEYIKVLESPLVWIVPKDIEEKDWYSTPMILPESGDIAAIINTHLKSQSLQMTIHSYAKGHEAILAMVAAGIGSAILPQIVVDNSYLKNSVTIMEQNMKMPHLEIGMFLTKRSLASPSNKAFWDFIEQRF